MSREDLVKILHNYENGNASPLEKELIEGWLESYSIKNDSTGDSAAIYQSDFADELFEKIIAVNIRKQKARRTLVFSGIAASLLIIVTAGLLILQATRKTQPMLVAKYRPAAAKTVKQVQLVVNAKPIDLQAAKQGISINNGNIRYQDGKNIISVTEQATLITPKGATYRLVLGDGSVVTLNAMSSLEFPTMFKEGAPRIVKLNGEGYFEIAKKTRAGSPKQRVPFIVIANHQQVEVLGTHFNVKSYIEDESSEVSLIEGQVRATNGRQKVLLSPGQAFVCNSSSGYVKPVDTEEILSWMKGQIVFNDEPLDAIMRKIARWYDMDVDFENTADQKKRYGGSISLKDDITKSLRQLELTGSVRFKVSERRISVMN